MKILLDECVPRAIKHSFSVDGHECVTVPEAGFAGKTNGELLTLSENRFDVFVTVDKGVQFRQNVAGFKIGIVLIRASSNRVADILPHMPACLAALRHISPGQLIQVGNK
jgi:predicted nuclease of predicted toxin-antitoxin system